MGLKMGTVKLEEYSMKWQEMFKEEKENLSKLFGDLAIEIEHIGSTAIEGLSAKPIIDIAVGVENLKDFEKVKKYFLEAPYSVKEDSVVDEILVRRGNAENITHFIHVMEINNERYKNTILFRNYLRNHKDVLIEYEELKKELAIKYADDRKMYTSSKNEFIQEILQKAKEKVNNN